MPKRKVKVDDVVEEKVVDKELKDVLLDRGVISDKNHKTYSPSQFIKAADKYNGSILKTLKGELEIHYDKDLVLGL